LDCWFCGNTLQNYIENVNGLHETSPTLTTLEEVTLYLYHEYFKISIIFTIFFGTVIIIISLESFVRKNQNLIAGKNKEITDLKKCNSEFVEELQQLQSLLLDRKICKIEFNYK